MHPNHAPAPLSQNPCMDKAQLVPLLCPNSTMLPSTAFLSSPRRWKKQKGVPKRNPWPVSVAGALLRAGHGQPWGARTCLRNLACNSRSHRFLEALGCCQEDRGGGEESCGPCLRRLRACHGDADKIKSAGSRRVVSVRNSRGVGS